MHVCLQCGELDPGSLEWGFCLWAIPGHSHSQLWLAFPWLVTQTPTVVKIYPDCWRNFRYLFEGMESVTWTLLREAGGWMLLPVYVCVGGGHIILMVVASYSMLWSRFTLTAIGSGGPQVLCLPWTCPVITECFLFRSLETLWIPLLKEKTWAGYSSSDRNLSTFKDEERGFLEVKGQPGLRREFQARLVWDKEWVRACLIRKRKGRA